MPMLSAKPELHEYSEHIHISTTQIWFGQQQSLASTWFTIIRTSNRIKNSSRNKQIGRRK